MSMCDEHNDIANRLESVLADLDRLGLHNIAVHVDLALRRFEEHLASHQSSETESPSILQK
jgi:hypothetical protein